MYALAQGKAEAEKGRSPRRRSSPPPRSFGEGGECHLDEAPAHSGLERNPRRDNGDAVERTIDLVCEVGERVRERVVDRASGGACRVETCQLPITRVRAHELQVGVEC